MHLCILHYEHLVYICWLIKLDILWCLTSKEKNFPSEYRSSYSLSQLVPQAYQMSKNACPPPHRPSCWREAWVFQGVPRKTIRNESIFICLFWLLGMCLVVGATYSSCRCKALKWQNGTVFPSGLTALEPHWDPGERGARFCYTLPTKAIREECISVNDYSLTPLGSQCQREAFSRLPIRD